MITFRVIQGAGAAMMFPAALAIVIASFPVAERGKAMAIFFAITGGLTAVGPLAGGYLTEIDWRAIFWVNIPVAIIALVLTTISKPENEKRPAPIDYRGAVLVTAGMGLAVLGLQQSSIWGWGDVRDDRLHRRRPPSSSPSSAYELRVEHPLLKVSIFKSRGFTVDNIVLFMLTIAFVPLFFFASTYAQISLGDSASEAGLYLLTFFAGFASPRRSAAASSTRAERARGRARAASSTAVGLYLWAQQLHRARLQQPVALDRPHRRRDRARPRARQHRRDQPRDGRELRRGHGDHPDRAQLRLEPRPRGARLGPDPPEQDEYRELARRARGSRRDEADEIADALTHAGGGDSAQLRRARRREGEGDLRRDPARLRRGDAGSSSTRWRA